jgi:hypothetical protein
VGASGVPLIQKLGARNRTHAVAVALRRNFID